MHRFVKLYCRGPLLSIIVASEPMKEREARPREQLDFLPLVASPPRSSAVARALKHRCTVVLVDLSTSVGNSIAHGQSY